MKSEASAPANIALIKYMGKGASNLPTNASLSYSLDHLRSFVTLTLSDHADRDEWQPLAGFVQFDLSLAGQQKFLAHFQQLKSNWGIIGNFIIRSANNFPSDCGLASSASSFAALTKATAGLVRESERKFDAHELSRLSRMGSGSSCRSFFSPWALWQGEAAQPLDLGLRLEHAVIIVASAKKSVSSSEAHVRVNSSLLFNGRPGRAEHRLQLLLEFLKAGNWRSVFEICWSEFWDMHALFETSLPHFGYMTADSIKVLHRMSEIWSETDDGPLVTMDAGPNIHLLLRPEQTREADLWLNGMNALKSWS